MNTTENRRRFERLRLTEDAIAVDESGFQYGHISQASGGGMLVVTASAEALERLKIGNRMMVSVVEPTLSTTNTFYVEVRYITGKSVGMEFL